MQQNSYQVNVSLTEVFLDIGLGVGGDVAEAALELARDLVDRSGKTRLRLSSRKRREHFLQIT